MIPAPNLVAVTDVGHQGYPAPPFSPSEAYPEFGGADISSAANPVYQGVRDLFISLGLDRSNLGTRRWNPLGEIIHPGDRVLIKPNLVRHYHPYGLDPLAIFTHASILRPICDYALIAAGPRGRLVIADAPLQSCDFTAVVKLSGIGQLVGYYGGRGIEIGLRDLRLVRAIVDNGTIWDRLLSDRT